MTIVCNLFGGPGAGKSTTRAGVFHHLKLAGYNVEEVPELAKELTWESRKMALACQPYMFGHQLFSTQRLVGQVEAVITDSPLLLAHVYGKQEGENFAKYVMEKFNSFKTMNFLLERVKAYNPKGRNQDLDGAKAIDDITENILKDNMVSFYRTSGDARGVDFIVNQMKRKLDHYRIEMV